MEIKLEKSEVSAIVIVNADRSMSEGQLEILRRQVQDFVERALVDHENLSENDYDEYDFTGSLYYTRATDHDFGTSIRIIVDGVVDYYTVEQMLQRFISVIREDKTKIYSTYYEPRTEISVEYKGEISHSRVGAISADILTLTAASAVN